jgi:hypothetical protein
MSIDFCKLKLVAFAVHLCRLWASFSSLISYTNDRTFKFVVQTSKTMSAHVCVNMEKNEHMQVFLLHQISSFFVKKNTKVTQRFCWEKNSPMVLLYKQKICILLLAEVPKTKILFVRTSRCGTVKFVHSRVLSKD